MPAKKELNIYQRLHAVMSEVSYVRKEDKKVNNQYTFVSHDAVTAKLRPSFVTHGIMPIVRVVSHTSNGNRCEANIEVDFVNIDQPDDKVTVPAFGYGIDQQDKGPGKAVSYAFKYACLKTFALETGDDPEKDQIEHEPDKGINPTDGVWEAQSEESQEFLSRIAESVAGALDEGEALDAANIINEQKLNADEKVALWTRFNSKQRSALKKAMTQLKETA